MKHPTGTIAAVVTTHSPSASCRAREKTRGGFAAVPTPGGGQDVFGPYDPVQNWPAALSESLPNHEVDLVTGDRCLRGSPDRVFVTQKGELPVPNLGRGTTWLRRSGQHQVSRRRRLAGA
jgi:hypothetical protein